MARRRGYQRFAGLNWLAGGAAAAVILPVLSLGFRVPFWLALIIAVCTCGGIVLVAAPRSRFEGMDVSAVARGKMELAAELLEEAEPIIDQLALIGPQIRFKGTRDRVQHLAEVARHIMDVVSTDPLKVNLVRRFITYYLPRAGEMATAYQLLERRPTPDKARLAQTRQMIERLDEAFTKYADNLVDADLDTLNIELKLLKDALDDDLGTSRSPPSNSPPNPAQRSAR
jgi:5-bromo-4-chloroindolyl phosphate hydrolysis protein